MKRPLEALDAASAAVRYAKISVVLAGIFKACFIIYMLDRSPVWACVLVVLFS